MCPSSPLQHIRPAGHKSTLERHIMHSLYSLVVLDKPLSMFLFLGERRLLQRKNARDSSRNGTVWNAGETTQTPPVLARAEILHTPLSKYAKEHAKTAPLGDSPAPAIAPCMLNGGYSRCFPPTVHVQSCTGSRAPFASCADARGILNTVASQFAKRRRAHFLLPALHGALRQ